VKHKNQTQNRKFIVCDTKKTIGLMVSRFGFKGTAISKLHSIVVGGIPLAKKVN